MSDFAHSCCTESSALSGTAELWEPHDALDQFLFLEPAAPLFVRSCYERLWPEVVKRIMHRLPSRSRGALILGTPGIGKSCFLNYALVRLLELPKHERPAIVLDTAGYYALIKPDGTVTHGSRETDFKAELRQRSTLYLYDARQGRYPMPFSARVLATSSPNREQYKDLDVPDMAVFYMPPWSLEELETYRRFSLSGMPVSWLLMGQRLFVMCVSVVDILLAVCAVGSSHDVYLVDVQVPCPLRLWNSSATCGEAWPAGY